MFSKFNLLFMILSHTSMDAFSEEIEKAAISRGTMARQGQFPYVVYISTTPMTPLDYYDGSDCTGAILTEVWVVTAAHCYIGYGKHNIDLGDVLTEVKAGTLDYEHDAGTTQIRTSRHHVMMEKNPNSELWESFNNDVLILKVAEPFLFNLNVGPITVAKRPLPEGVKTVCTSVGFGATSERNESGYYNSKLFFTHATIDGDRFSCRKRSEKRRDKVAQSFGEEHVCIDPVQYKSAPCHGDSGGPLVCNGLDVGTSVGRFNKWHYEAHCGRKGNYHVYAFLGFYEDWLRKYIPELPSFQLITDLTTEPPPGREPQPGLEPEPEPRPKPKPKHRAVPNGCHTKFRVGDIALVLLIDCVWFRLRSSLL